MECITSEGVDEEIDLVLSADYDVLPRPEELIATHLRSSSSKLPRLQELVAVHKRSSSLKLPRSQELVTIHKRSSSSKDVKDKTTKDHKRKTSKRTKEKMSPKEKSLPKEKFSPKEKAMRNKLIMKTFTSLKSNIKANVDLRDSKVLGLLDSKFESYVKKAVKSLHSYSPKIDNNMNDNIEKPTKQQYLNSLTKRTFTAQERYDVLNAKDNLFRLGDTNKGESRIKKISGTCPDMCPEKERYSRIAKNCWSPLETKMRIDPWFSSKEVDHHYMVKEYSRSSADQQEPLPHELRPVSVLKLTMNYLICNIVNQRPPHISTADWFDFIWNRTRSIRKDITQQQLCDPDSVEIIEKCVRFHIFCAEALSEEATAVFDPKINNENLTKCMQTLKHMYYDLQTKGIHCPNEAEFRAYDILLSLTEGETLRLVKDIHKNIVKSPYIRFAFDVALAFESNNYVKFFKLVEETSFLNSCILHRYIHEARVRAIKVIIRAYSTPNLSLSYALSNLVKDLKFENEQEAAEFCQWHGLNVEANNVTIERQVFSKPSSSFPVSRSSVLVNKKLTTSLGEVINNGPLPENPLQQYVPYNSFDEEGFLHDESFPLKLNEINEENIIEDMDQDAVEESVCKESITVIPPKETEIVNTDVFNEEYWNEPYTLLNKRHENIQLPQSLPSKPQNMLAQLVKQTEFSFSTAASSPSAASSPFAEATKPKSPTISKNQMESNTFSFPLPTGPKDKQVCNVLTGIKPKSPKIDIQTSSSAMTSFAFVPTISTPNTPTQQFLNLSTSLSKQEVLHIGPPVVKWPTQFQYKETNSSDIHQKGDLEKRSEKILSPFQNTSQLNIDLNQRDYVYLKNLDDVSSMVDSGENEIKLKLKRAAFESTILSVMEEVYNDCIKDMSTKICIKTIGYELMLKKRYEDVLTQIRENLARKTLYKWQLFCQRKKQRNLIENFEPVSPWISMLRNTEYKSSGATSPYSAYKAHCYLSRLADLKIKEQKHKLGWEPFDAWDFSAVMNLHNNSPAYLKGIGTEKFIKIGIVFANYEDKIVSTYLEWICSKFKLTKLPDKNGTNPKYMSFYTMNRGTTVISIRCLVYKSSSFSDAREFLRGASGIILCCPIKFPNPESFRSVMQWMSSIFDDKNVPQPLPLLLALMSSVENHPIHHQLSSFLDERLRLGRNFSVVKMIQIPHIPNYVQCSKNLGNGLKMLIASIEPPPEIISCSLRNFLEDSFATAFSTLFWKLSLSEFKALLQQPQEMITFYNEVIKARGSLLTSDLLKKVADFWPPSELMILHPGYKFITFRLQQKCEEFMKLICLPPFNGDSNSTIDLWFYIEDITGTPSTDKYKLQRSVKELLETEPTTYWPHVISKCAYYMICDGSSKFTEYLKKDVFLAKNDLEAMNFDRYWQLLSLSLKKKEQKENKKRHMSISKLLSLKRRKSSTFFETSTPDLTKLSKNSFSIIRVSSSPIKLAAPNEARIDRMLQSLQTAVKKQSMDEDKYLLKLKSLATEVADRALMTSCQDEIDEAQKYQSNLSQMEIRHQSVFPNNSLNAVESTKLKESDDWKTLVGRASQTSAHSTPNTLFEKLAELKYNMQRNKILEEDSFNQLLGT